MKTLSQGRLRRELITYIPHLVDGKSKRFLYSDSKQRMVSRRVVVQQLKNVAGDRCRLLSERFYQMEFNSAMSGVIEMSRTGFCRYDGDCGDFRPRRPAFGHPLSAR